MGRLDILATDDEGNIFIVECKLEDNPDMKTIRSQIQNYAAGFFKDCKTNGIDSFWEWLIENIKNQNEELNNIFEKNGIEDNEQIEEILEEAKSTRDNMLELLSDNDESIMEDYLEGKDIERDRIIAAIRKQTIHLDIVPVICGSAFKNKGVQLLLDAVKRYLPSPLDIPPIKGTDVDDESKEMERIPSDDEPLSALAFKIMTDPFVGTITYIRVYSGVLNSGSAVFNPTKNATERVGRLLKMHADKREDITSVCAGDIAAAVGLKNTYTGETLCDKSNPIVLESLNFKSKN